MGKKAPKQVGEIDMAQLNPKNEKESKRVKAEKENWFFRFERSRWTQFFAAVFCGVWAAVFLLFSGKINLSLDGGNGCVAVYQNDEWIAYPVNPQILIPKGDKKVNVAAEYETDLIVGAGLYALLTLLFISKLVNNWCCNHRLTNIILSTFQGMFGFTTLCWLAWTGYIRFSPPGWKCCADYLP